MGGAEVALALVAFAAVLSCSTASWSSTPPVKLLAVESVATRYAAAGNVASGGHRTNIENGFVS